LDLFINFLNILPDKNRPENVENLNSQVNNIEKFDILETINIKDKVILMGIVSDGSILLENQYFLGPDSEGNFKLVSIVNIHCKKVEVRSANQGQYCSILLDSSVTKESIRKGMVLVDVAKEPKACRLFEAEVWNIDNSDTKFKYTAQPVVNISHIRQGVKIRKLDELNSNQPLDSNADDEIVLSPNNSLRIGFEFIYQPEYITEGSHLIIVESNVKLYGYIKKIIK
jgi:GTPase